MRHIMVQRRLHRETTGTLWYCSRGSKNVKGFFNVDTLKVCECRGEGVARRDGCFSLQKFEGFLRGKGLVQ